MEFEKILPTFQKQKGGTENQILIPPSLLLLRRGEHRLQIRQWRLKKSLRDTVNSQWGFASGFQILLRLFKGDLTVTQKSELKTKRINIYEDT